MTTDAYLKKPVYGELALILCAGIANPLIQVLASAKAAYVYNIGISLLIGSYLVWRIRRHPGIWRAWGFRTDNFWLALRQLGPVFVLSAGALNVYGLAAGTTLPASFYITAAIYPVWGIAQQFALQNLLVRHLQNLIPNNLTRSVAAAICFALAHYPSVPLMILTFVSGVIFTWYYSKTPSIWAIGIVHGILGALAFYLVLDLDPLALATTYFGR